MKQNFLVLSLGLLVLLFSGCSSIVDYNDDYTPAHDIANTGAPVITAVYNISDTENETPLTEGEVGMMLKIVGKNLNNVKSIRFVTADPQLSGDADLTEAYTYSTAANVTIPASIGQKVKSIEYTTDMGTVSYPFVVPFPSLEVSTEQYMLQGEKLTVYGRYFDKYKNVKVFAGADELQVETSTETTLTTNIPAGYTGTIDFKWQDGDGVEQTSSVAMRPVENLLYGDFSGVSFGNDGITYTIEDDNAVPAASPLGRKHLHTTASLGAWAWKTLDLSQNMPFEVSNPADCVFVFEIMTPEDSPLISSEVGNELLLFQFNWDKMINWAPGQGSGLNTHGQWMTISLPLDGMSISNKDSWQTIRTVFHPNAAWNVDLRWANFRILKK